MTGRKAYAIGLGAMYLPGAILASVEVWPSVPAIAFLFAPVVVSCILLLTPNR